jgi:hypothetical protein
VDAWKFLSEEGENVEHTVYRVYRGAGHAHQISGDDQYLTRFVWSRTVVRYWEHILRLAYHTSAGSLGYSGDLSLFGCVPHAVYAAGLGDSVARFMRQTLLIASAKDLGKFWLSDCQLLIQLVPPEDRIGLERSPYWLLWNPFNVSGPNQGTELGEGEVRQHAHHLLLVRSNVMYNPGLSDTGEFSAALRCETPVFEWAPFVPPGRDRGLASRLTANDMAYILLARIIYLAAKHFPNKYRLRLTRYWERGNEREARDVMVTI